MATGAAAPGERVRDAERTRAEIVEVATHEFADQGYAGARVDEIAAKTRTTKRMIYYYFGGKEGLYLAVLEQAYQHIRALEQKLDVDHLEPVEALRKLAELTFDHHEQHQDFVRLVAIENIHYAQHLLKSEVRDGLAAPALEVLTRIMGRGVAAGLFRDDVDALDVHQVISAFCIFRGANRYTFRAIFDRDLLDPSRRAHQRQMIGDLVVAHVTAAPPR
ncbi:TetR/AcrR family transcriptional regulator [Actinoplanes sp. Pm04-4]|uniref:TetR/AcrR family transcriptional regulator n=1 Tax=Paractinoplanes pyxinae TaxID=2997416 RepID=A0ABT4B9Q0_9ACTN|nr:TetR/AcrR family transcriptional regulator [Actinoplanes pyxinae]MCY1143227.1 TetR/AcrR family transcriptional regulator [Actinoplanes pyxinae]